MSAAGQPDQPAAGSGAELAVLAEGAKKAALLWVRRADGSAQPVWHVWHDGAAYVLCGGSEQPAPDLDRPEVEVSVRSKDTGARLGVWAASVTPVTPGSAEWESVVPLLAGKRLNAPDGPDAPFRWARTSSLYRLTPTGAVRESWAQPQSGSGAAEPGATPATTRVRLPFVIGRRPGRPR